MKPLLMPLRAVALVLLAAATVYALHRWSLEPFRCARIAVTGGRALDRAENQPEAVRLRVARDLSARLRPCECVRPLNVQIYHSLARALAVQGDHRGAIAAYQRALTIDRRPEIYFSLGMSYLETLDRQAAVENFARAVAFDPSRLEDIPYAEVQKETKARLR